MTSCYPWVPTLEFTPSGSWCWIHCVNCQWWQLDQDTIHHRRLCLCWVRCKSMTKRIGLTIFVIEVLWTLAHSGKWPHATYSLPFSLKNGTTTLSQTSSTTWAAFKCALQPSWLLQTGHLQMGDDHLQHHDRNLTKTKKTRETAAMKRKGTATRT